MGMTEREKGDRILLLFKIKSAYPLFCFNGVNPTLLLVPRVLSGLLRSAGNSTPGFVDLEWWKNNT